MDKFKQAYGNDDKKHTEIIEFMINKFFVDGEKVL
jgi:hypothetical protein